MSEFYDTHAHLDYQDFTGDLVAVVERAQAAGVTRMISIGTDFTSSERAIQLSERFPSIWAVVGWHPSYATGAPDDLRPTLRRWAAHPRVVAIGETGLDYSRLPGKQPDGDASQDGGIMRKQAAIFTQQLEVAAEFGLNAIVHQRAALDDTLAQLQPYAGRVRAVFHCFTDDRAALVRVLASGALVSFTGIVTFKNAQNVRDSLAATPLDRLMLETDCPFLAPVPYRGKRCEPAYVKEIAEAVARIKECSPEELSAVTCATARGFFPKMEPEAGRL